MFGKVLDTPVIGVSGKMAEYQLCNSGNSRELTGQFGIVLDASVGSRPNPRRLVGQSGMLPDALGG